MQCMQSIQIFMTISYRAHKYIASHIDAEPHVDVHTLHQITFKVR